MSAARTRRFRVDEPLSHFEDIDGTYYARYDVTEEGTEPNANGMVPDDSIQFRIDLHNGPRHDDEPLFNLVAGDIIEIRVTKARDGQT